MLTHLSRGVRAEQWESHTHVFLVEKIFKSKKQNLIFKVRWLIKHERMSLASGVHL